MDMIVDSEKRTWLDKEPSKSELRNVHLKQIVKNISEGGCSSHSAFGMTLKMTLKRLEQAGVSYQLTAHPGIGYHVQGIKREEWMDKND